MATNPFTVDSIIDLLQTLEAFPIDQRRFTTEKLCKLLDLSFQNNIIPLIKGCSEEYFVRSVYYDISENLSEITLPSVTIGMACRMVSWVDSNDNFVRLTRIQPENINAYYTLGNTVPFGVGGYYIEGNKIKFYPHLQGTGRIKLSIFRRPNNLTTLDNAGKIVSIDTGSNTFTVDNAPDSWDTGTILDATEAVQDFDFTAEAFTIVSKSGLDIEVSAEVLSNLSVGDYVCDSGYAVFPQYIPVEAHGVLAQWTAQKCLQSLNDIDGIKVLIPILKEMSEGLRIMITPRVVSETKKLSASPTYRRGGGWF